VHWMSRRSRPHYRPGLEWILGVAFPYTLTRPVRLAQGLPFVRCCGSSRASSPHGLTAPGPASHDGDDCVQLPLARGCYHLEPIFEPTFHPSSHGFRPRRGAHTAIAEATGYLKDGYQTVVDLDLAKFFDRVHHQRLLARIAERVKDPRIVALVRLMLKAAVIMPDGTKIAVQEGTPQGGPLSPLLSNIVLNELDGELARRGLRFVRYADDCNIFVRSERAGKRVMASIRGFLETRMRLQVNEAKSGVRAPDEVQFLGFSFRCTRGEEGDRVAV